MYTPVDHKDDEYVVPGNVPSYVHTPWTVGERKVGGVGIVKFDNTLTVFCICLFFVFLFFIYNCTSTDY